MISNEIIVGEITDKHTQRHMNAVPKQIYLFSVVLRMIVWTRLLEINILAL